MDNLSTNYHTITVTFLRSARIYLLHLWHSYLPASFRSIFTRSILVSLTFIPQFSVTFDFLSRPKIYLFTIFQILQNSSIRWLNVLKLSYFQKLHKQLVLKYLPIINLAIAILTLCMRVTLERVFYILLVVTGNRLKACFCIWILYFSLEYYICLSKMYIFSTR